MFSPYRSRLGFGDQSLPDPGHLLVPVHEIVPVRGEAFVVVPFLRLQTAVAGADDLQDVTDRGLLHVAVQSVWPRPLQEVLLPAVVRHKLHKEKHSEPVTVVITVTTQVYKQLNVKCT